MSNIITSFRSLAMTNNGFFKSEKQSVFLLSRCQDNIYISFDSNPQTSWNDTVYCDDRGILKIVRTTSNGNVKPTFIRIVAGMEMTDVHKKKIKSYERKIKIAQGKIDERLDSTYEFAAHAIAGYNTDIQNLNKWINDIKSQYIHI